MATRTRMATAMPVASRIHTPSAMAGRPGSRSATPSSPPCMPSQLSVWSSGVLSTQSTSSEVKVADSMLESETDTFRRVAADQQRVHVHIPMMKLALSYSIGYC